MHDMALEVFQCRRILNLFFLLFFFFFFVKCQNIDILFVEKEIEAAFYFSPENDSDNFITASNIGVKGLNRDNVSLGKRERMFFARSQSFISPWLSPLCSAFSTYRVLM